MAVTVISGKLADQSSDDGHLAGALHAIMLIETHGNVTGLACCVAQAVTGFAQIRPCWAAELRLRS